MTEQTTLDTITTHPGDLANRAAHAAQADATARMNKFATYRLKKAQNTVKRQDAELARFGASLTPVGVNMGQDADQWAGVTWGLVDSFCKQLLMAGYALGTISCHLATIKRYARLAVAAGTLEREAYAMIALCEATTHKERKNVDAARVAMGVATRRPTAKKAHARVLSQDQLDALASQCDDSDQGRRDALILMLLGGLGLRVSEAHALRREHFDAATNKLEAYRQKTDVTTNFRLGNGNLRAMLRYLDATEGDAGDQLLQGSSRWGRLTPGMSIRAIRLRIKTLAARIEIHDLSPHDFRHSRATLMAPDSSMLELMAFFGWSSPSMAVRYCQAAEVIEAD